jgi:hypothetical protein
MPFQRTIDFNDPVEVAHVCRQMRDQRGELEVIVREPKRSSAQNRRYWIAVVEPLTELMTETQGQEWTPEATHEFLKASFLPLDERVDPISGEVKQLPMSTTLLRKNEFSILMEKGEALIEFLRNQHQGCG